MRGEQPPPEADGTPLTIDLPLSAHLPPAYVPDLNVRLALYQRLSAAGEPKEVAAIRQEMVDRFGEPRGQRATSFYLFRFHPLPSRFKGRRIRTQVAAAAWRIREEKPRAAMPLEGAVWR